MSNPVQSLSATLSASFSPDNNVRKQAEATLKSAEPSSGFLILLLQLINSSDVDMTIRQQGAVYFKNTVKNLWSGEEDVQIPDADKAQIKSQLVPIMISLGTPETSRVQSQICEALSEIAAIDFPTQWEGLIDELVSSLTPDNFVVNNAVLATAHSIFKRWRSKFQSNQLYTEINLVLTKFCQPYYQLFAHVDQLLSSTQPLPATASIQSLTQSLELLLELYHDLCSQDLPPFIEENMGVFMGAEDGSQEGWLRKYLIWERAEVRGDDDDVTPGPLQRIRGSICEIAELFAQKYLDDFKQLTGFVESVWKMLKSIGPGIREDSLVSRGLGFLSAVVKMGANRSMFETPGTLDAFCENIILPNMILREHEVEMFEDDPNEYMRRDLEPAADSEIRRQAATDFTRALMENFESEVTNIIKLRIDQNLQDPANNWKSKDTAIYLLTSIASRGSTQQLGVTSTNILVDVVQFFGTNVFADLQAAEGSVHPILVVDAVKFLYTFRNQLTKDQLLSVLPILVQHLASQNVVVYSYAAITIERILFLKKDRQAQFTSTDIRPFAENILMALFANIERGATPEKMSENDYLMKCAMRVIITAKQSLTPVYQPILNRLVNILGEISKNPSNPKFNQYCFEAVSALIRFTCEGSPVALTTFEGALFGPAQGILTREIAEFIPYIFQILSQLLELHPASQGLPEDYKALVSPLLNAALWEAKANIPALTRIWRAMLMRGGPLIASSSLNGLLGTCQRLITSKVNDAYGFELLQAMYEFLPLPIMQQNSQAIFMMLLNRLQSKPSPQYTQGFVYFVCYISALEQVGPDLFIGVLDTIQPGLFGNLQTGIILANTQKMPIKWRKVAEVGLTRMLTRSDLILTPANQQHWAPTFIALMDLFNLPQDLTYANGAGTDLNDLDPEDSAFQSSFNKLGASEAAVHDPFSQIVDPKRFASAEIARASRKRGGSLIKGLMEQARGVEGGALESCEQYMASIGETVSA